MVLKLFFNLFLSISILFSLIGAALSADMLKFKKKQDCLQFQRNIKTLGYTLRDKTGKPTTLRWNDRSSHVACHTAVEMPELFPGLMRQKEKNCEKNSDSKECKTAKSILIILCSNAGEKYKKYCISPNDEKIATIHKEQGKCRVLVPSKFKLKTEKCQILSQSKECTKAKRNLLGACVRCSKEKEVYTRYCS
ncbi:MAG: hypothetical protein ACRBBN_21105 [Methyloligellaceae bacterium]